MAKTRPRFQTESIIKTWPMVRLGDVCTIEFGTRVRRKDSQGGDYPVYGGGGATFCWSTYNREDQCIVSRFAMSEECVRFVKGKFFLNDSGLSVRSDNQDLSQTYLDWVLYSKQPEIYALGRGAAQKNLDVEQFVDMMLPLPPLSVQREIVARLERELAAVEKMKKGFEALAETARAEFKAELKEVFEEDCSCEKTWDEVFYTTTGKLDSNCAISDGKYPFFTCSKEVLRINEWAFDCEALLLAGNNAAGKYDVKHYVGKFNAYQRTYVLTLKNADWEYKLFQAQLENLLQYLQDKSKGTGTRYLTMGILRTLRFYVPEPFVQREVVSRLDGAKAKAEKLEAKAREGVAVCETMRKAILKEAFE